MYQMKISMLEFYYTQTKNRTRKVFIDDKFNVFHTYYSYYSDKYHTIE